MEGGQKSGPLQFPLIPRQDSDGELHQVEKGYFYRGEEIIEEAKRQVCLAGPLIGVSLLQYSLQVISIMFAGHLGELSLSSASMATSFASVTGFSVLLGMGSALEILCGQAYGAKQYHMLGIHTQRAMLTLLALTTPLAVIWFYTTIILTAFGQDHEISIEAGTFNRWMIPSLFAYALLQCLNRFLQTQNIVVPMMISSRVTALFHVFLCWLLVIRFSLGTKGAALANAISNWINVILLAVYIKFSPTCMKTWTGFSKESLHDILNFLKLAIPSAIMICFEYWSFEMVVLLSGLLPNPKLETSVLSVSLNTCWMVYMISVGLGGAISVWGKLYSNEQEVIQYVAQMMPLLALSDFLDGFQCVLSGATRGRGWQNLCAGINLGAYYVVGIPSSMPFAFIFHIGGMGLWMGIICGLSIQVIALITINLCTDWDNEARESASRVQTTGVAVE